MRALRVSLPVIAAVVAIASRGSAQGQDAASAEALFREGKERLAAGRIDEACTIFAESLRLDAATGTLLNLADCEERQGKLASAWQRFVEAKASLPPEDYRLAFVDERLAALDSRVPRLALGLHTPVDGARILRDGVELRAPSRGVPLPVNPGEHTLVVLAPGRRETRTTVRLAEGERRSLVLVLGEPEGPVAPSSRRTPGLVLLGVGALGLVTGAITGIVTLDAATRYKSGCTNGVCNDDGIDAARTGHRYEIVSPLALAVGVVGIAVGTFVLLSGPKAGTAVTVAPSSSGATVGVTRSWL